ncbi:MAG: hypothetical protein ABI171_08685 [Collimonas sp.]|uniref:hypothetical protein n=1 Tax=Collimonas sp. TaxID=1963772 RepID=UPI0032647F63
MRFPNSNSETVNIDLSWWISSLSYEHYRYQTNEFLRYFDIDLDINVKKDKLPGEPFAANHKRINTEASVKTLGPAY